MHERGGGPQLDIYLVCFVTECIFSDFRQAEVENMHFWSFLHVTNIKSAVFE